MFPDSKLFRININVSKTMIYIKIKSVSKLVCSFEQDDLFINPGYLNDVGSHAYEKFIQRFAKQMRIAKNYIKSITELHIDKTLCIYHRLSLYYIDTRELLEVRSNKVWMYRKEVENFMS